MGERITIGYTVASCVLCRVIAWIPRLRCAGEQAVHSKRFRRKGLTGFDDYRQGSRARDPVGPSAPAVLNAENPRRRIPAGPLSVRSVPAAPCS